MKPYRDYSDFLKEHFDYKVQKIPLSIGSTCPNRDGTIGTGGCIYCNNNSFSPSYCHEATDIVRQIEAGKRFFGKRYTNMRYLAYFQAYTSTHMPICDFMGLVRNAINVEDIEGVVISTRPDCINEDLLSNLQRIKEEGKFVMLEFGVESFNDHTLQRINRGHNSAIAIEAIKKTAEYGFPVGVHLILGLPGEKEEDMLATADQISSLPVSVVKLHQMQVVKGTKLAALFDEGKADIMQWTADQYIDMCISFLSHLRKDIAIERFTSSSPAELLIYPQWGLKPAQFTERLISKILS